MHPLPNPSPITGTSCRLPLQLCPIVDVVLGLVNDQLGLVDCKSFPLCFVQPASASPDRGPATEGTGDVACLGGGPSVVGAHLLRPLECGAADATRERLPGQTFPTWPRGSGSGLGLGSWV